MSARASTKTTKQVHRHGEVDRRHRRDAHGDHGRQGRPMVRSVLRRSASQRSHPARLTPLNDAPRRPAPRKSHILNEHLSRIAWRRWASTTEQRSNHSCCVRADVRSWPSRSKPNPSSAEASAPSPVPRPSSPSAATSPPSARTASTLLPLYHALLGTPWTPAAQAT
jgi:hypothetical protein